MSLLLLPHFCILFTKITQIPQFHLYEIPRIDSFTKTEVDGSSPGVQGEWRVGEMAEWGWGVILV